MYFSLNIDLDKLLLSDCLSPHPIQALDFSISLVVVVIVVVYLELSDITNVSELLRPALLLQDPINSKGIAHKLRPSPNQL